MSAAAAAPAATASRNPFEAARSHLIRRLLEIKVPTARAIGEAADHIRDAANLFDEWLLAVGDQVGATVTSDFDIRPFQGAFLGAVDGNATYEVECADSADRRRNSFIRRGAWEGV